MNTPLETDDWMTMGISLLWDADALNRLCRVDQAVSLREFLRLHGESWEGVDARLINKRALLVAGLDAAIDSLSPADATQWMEDTLYPAIRDYQQAVADGGREASLVFWLPDHRRIELKAAEGNFQWLCAGEHRHERLSIGRCIWNGAQDSVQKIITHDAHKKERWLGLFEARIS
jgi:hypothetical protein